MDERRTYILNWREYLHSLMEKPEAVTYMHKVRDFFELMKPGQRVRLKAEGEKQRWLWVVTGAFLCETDHGHRFELDDDYQFLVCIS